LRRTPEKIIDRAERPLLTNSQIANLQISIMTIANSETDNRPLADVAKKLEQKSSCLKYWFPMECALISKKFATQKKEIGLKNAQAGIDAVSNIIEELQKRNEYVSNRKVNNHLLKQGMSLARPALFNAFKSKLKKC
jgi:hypothetical protein